MRRTGFLLMFIFIAGAATFAQNTMVLKSKTAKVISPYSSDFNLDFSSSNLALKKLTSIIESGRKKKSAETLLSAAMILFMEEKSTGKKSNITGISLLKEATEIALRSKSKKLLKLVSDYWADPAFGNNSKYAEDLIYDE
ncbi:MAG: hypothetical protein LC102_05505 [Ignavibacteriales bacterium]|jgi:hypothetical protein|nr:MAG: hypothetical protein F9K26_06600 [Ignavibacteriaceae bacterium]MBW7873223.1 hypothetical protein [Ignavibacteria bacterium]MCZ2142865.1 hypothetical protein [Ignavibacteriales bacterium]OQY70987.1 MAG: hypothetical protein B6D45_10610 [Ignavibacteriales bacterium UTCHB3]MBV6443959.1 hypothetical protein [Ignavibacteriaceae bacterium]